MPDPKASDGEFGLIARYFAGLDTGAAVVLGNGDDAALLALEAHESLAVSADTMVDGVHFPRGAPAARVVFRAVGAAASDLAAMGARPLAMTFALTLPNADEDWLRECRAGLRDAVTCFGLPLVGGDLTRGPLTLSVQVMGAVPREQALRRCGAKVGDRVFVGGPLGDVAAGLAILEQRVSLPPVIADGLLSCFWRPVPQFALGMALRGRASAMIDISDGLLADASHIASASGVCLRIDSDQIPLSPALLAAVPRTQALAWALTGGEDYVLCFTLPPDLTPPAGCVQIGAVEAGTGVRCDVAVDAAGYRHF